MSTPAFPHRLRLVGHTADVALPKPPPQVRQVLRPTGTSTALRLSSTPPPDVAPATDEVREANIQSASMSALDARWVLAVQVARALDGGPAAILTPENRRRLLVVGERVGLRPFDTNLVVAIVQDAARTGDDPLGPHVVDRLRLVHPADHLVGTRPPAPSLLSAARWTFVLFLLSLVILLALIRWVVGGA